MVQDYVRILKPTKRSCQKQSFKDKFCKVYDTLAHEKCEVYAVVNDLIPIKYPETVVNEAFKIMFVEWHNMLLEMADHILCISESVADDIVEYYQTSDIRRSKPLVVSYFPMGADLNLSKNKIDNWKGRVK